MSPPEEGQTVYEITLVRHGESIGNAEGYHQGQAEFRLTETGRQQARALARYWQERNVSFDVAIASPLHRARETAEIITHALELDLEFDELWMERDNGVLAGLKHEKAREKFPAPDFIPTYRAIGQEGESIWELYLRAGRAIQSLIHREPGRYLVIGHAGLFNMAMHALLGITPQPNFHGPRFPFQNSAFASLSYHPDHHNWYVHGVDQHPHWDAFQDHPS
jgi:broad specificity phosphatase PhoE